MRAVPVQQIGDDGRHDIEPGTAVFRRQPPEGLSAEAARQHHAAAVNQRRQHRDDLRVDVIKRQHVEHAIRLAQIVRGASSKEAARWLGVSPRTIEFHRANIMQKLGAKNVADLVRIVVGNTESSEGDD